MKPNDDTESGPEVDSRGDRTEDRPDFLEEMWEGDEHRRSEER